MNDTSQARHDFKQIDTASWQNADKPVAIWMQMTAVVKTPAEWADFFLQPQLKPTVPTEIVRLLEVARGAMICGWFLYPLLTLGADQCWRVLEAGVRLRCQQLGIKTKRTKEKGREEDTKFSENIGALLRSKIAVKLDKSRWDAVRKLRNSTSHPSRQVNSDPGLAQGVLATAVELLNDLFS